ncbi:uncharacterized protein LOC116738685 [Nasonia vitripennis]|uniref:BEN domain-containing protein n=1 Tax=Nasonia vitripennis TaxID=7425 RepID=A0A7M7R3V0_NASVI|nr:uncharacterized protein LOC116738685 [Nasonia vitripennis]
MDKISTTEAALGFIRKIDDTIHCGNNVYISHKAYDNAKNDAHKNEKADKLLSGYSAFVRNVAMSIIGAETLMKSSVTGKKCNRLNTTPKEKLDPKLVGAVYGIFEYYLKTEKQFNEVDIALHKKHVGGYIAQKCCDVNRKKSTKPQNTDGINDILIPEITETTGTPTESASEEDEGGDDKDGTDDDKNGTDDDKVSTDESSSESAEEDNQSNQI